MRNRIMLKAAMITAICGAYLAVNAADETKMDAKALYSKHCLSCHGKDGKGKTKMGRKTKVKDYTDPKVVAKLDDAVALKQIKEGLLEKGSKRKYRMKPYEKKLKDAEIMVLIAYMRKFAAQK